MQVNYRNFMLYRLLFSLKFVGAAFVSQSYELASASIISSHVIAEVLPKYIPFLQLHVAGFQI